jgi:hypothetical protein
MSRIGLKRLKLKEGREDRGREGERGEQIGQSSERFSEIIFSVKKSVSPLEYPTG